MKKRIYAFVGAPSINLDLWDVNIPENSVQKEEHHAPLWHIQTGGVSSHSDPACMSMGKQIPLSTCENSVVKNKQEALNGENNDGQQRDNPTGEYSADVLQMSTKVVSGDLVQNCPQVADFTESHWTVNSDVVHEPLSPELFDLDASAEGQFENSFQMKERKCCQIHETKEGKFGCREIFDDAKESQTLFPSFLSEECDGLQNSSRSTTWKRVSSDEHEEERNFKVLKKPPKHASSQSKDDVCVECKYKENSLCQLHRCLPHETGGMMFECVGSGLLCSQVSQPIATVDGRRLHQGRDWKCEVVHSVTIKEKSFGTAFPVSINCESSLEDYHTVASTEKSNFKRSVTSAHFHRKLEEQTETARSPKSSCQSDVQNNDAQNTVIAQRTLKGAYQQRSADKVGGSWQSSSKGMKNTDSGRVKTDTLRVCLSDRSGPGKNLLAVVLNSRGVRYVQATKGFCAGRSFSVSSLLLMDWLGDTATLELWRTAAFWALMLLPGDVVVITDVRSQKGSKHVQTTEVLTSTARSRMLHLGACEALHPQNWFSIVQPECLELLKACAAMRQPQILGRSGSGLAHVSAVDYVKLHDVIPGTVLHCVARVLSVRICSDPHVDPRLQRVVVRLQQEKGEVYWLLLYGQAKVYFEHLHKHLGRIWAFLYIVASEGPMTSATEFHSTPLSMCELLFNDDCRAVHFVACFSRKEPILEAPNIRSMLTSSYRGCATLQTKIVALNFYNNSFGNQTPLLTVNTATSLVSLATSLANLVYHGCESCAKELWADSNGIYSQCLSCIPVGHPHLFYRPAILQAQDESGMLSIRLSPHMVKKVFLNIPPGWLQNCAGHPGEPTYAELLADLCLSLVAAGKQCFHLLLLLHVDEDENDVPRERCCTLLQLHTLH
uniref:Shieldin complex subunit 2 C-terminal domain-containing protein n=1 Tax=Eptatretus burgeri TaxID=7764 RepID=A0A8C4R1E1_EPTBU